MSPRQLMRVLVVHHRGRFVERRTVDEHLYSFRRYAEPDWEIHYLNAYLGIPAWVTRLHFDLVIYHYTFMGMKWNSRTFPAFLARCEPLKHVSGHKMAIHQDEYVNSDQVNAFLRDFGVKTMVTCLLESEWEKVYPRARSGLEHYLTVAPGYVDEQALAWIRSLPPAPRTIDVGYRARSVPFWLGRHGTLKGSIAVEVEKAASGAGDLKLDISTAPEDVFYGDEWYRFLLRCRTVLGCEGGASLHDPDARIRDRVEAYVAAHPTATFDEVERACFPGLDGNLDLFAISPRHFECAMTRTTQVLVEGQYHGIMRPGVHYIAVKKDWSNLPEVLAQVRDVALCERLAEAAYQDLVASGQHTYRVFVKRLLDHARRVAPPPRRQRSLLEAALLKVLALREDEESRITSAHQTIARWRGIADAFRSDVTHADGSPDWYRLAAFVQPRVLRALRLTRVVELVKPRALRALGLRRAPWSTGPDDGKSPDG